MLYKHIVYLDVYSFLPVFVARSSHLSLMFCKCSSLSLESISLTKYIKVLNLRGVGVGRGEGGSPSTYCETGFRDSS